MVIDIFPSSFSSKKKTALYPGHRHHSYDTEHCVPHLPLCWLCNMHPIGLQSQEATYREDDATVDKVSIQHRFSHDRGCWRISV